MGRVDFPLLQVHCYPLGNVSMAFTALVLEIDLLGLTRSHSYNPVTISTLEYRNCIVGEYLVDRSCVACSTGSYLLAYTDNTVCLNCPTGADICFGNQIVVSSGYWRRFPDSHALGPVLGASVVTPQAMTFAMSDTKEYSVLCARRVTTKSRPQACALNVPVQMYSPRLSSSF